MHKQQKQNSRTADGWFNVSDLRNTLKSSSYSRSSQVSVQIATIPTRPRRIRIHSEPRGIACGSSNANKTVPDRPPTDPTD